MIRRRLAHLMHYWADRLERGETHRQRVLRRLGSGHEVQPRRMRAFLSESRRHEAEPQTRSERVLASSDAAGADAARLYQGDTPPAGRWQAASEVRVAAQSERARWAVK